MKRPHDSQVVGEPGSPLDLLVPLFAPHGPAPASGSIGLERSLMRLQKMEALGRATLGVAHEFNNLLGVIVGYADLLWTNASLNEEARSEVRELLAAAARAASLAQQLLGVGCKPVSSSPADLGVVVAGIRQLLLCLVGKAVQLVVVPAEQPCLVGVGAGELEQVVMNLVINARDATNLGGHIVVSTGRTRLERDLHHAHGTIPAGDHGRLSVSDNGCGMDDVTQARLFEPFFTTKGPGKGSGLGMSIVATILKESGGHIIVRSEPGQGTCFEVYWPLLR